MPTIFQAQWWALGIQRENDSVYVQEGPEFSGGDRNIIAGALGYESTKEGTVPGLQSDPTTAETKM